MGCAKLQHLFAASVIVHIRILYMTWHMPNLLPSKVTKLPPKHRTIKLPNAASPFHPALSYIIPV